MKDTTTAAQQRGSQSPERQEVMSRKVKKATEMTDAELKERLLELAKSGAPRPSKDSVLGRALERFTTRQQ